MIIMIQYIISFYLFIFIISTSSIYSTSTDLDIFLIFIVVAAAVTLLLSSSSLSTYHHNVANRPPTYTTTTISFTHNNTNRFAQHRSSLPSSSLSGGDISVSHNNNDILQPSPASVQSEFANKNLSFSPPSDPLSALNQHSMTALPACVCVHVKL